MNKVVLFFLLIVGCYSAQEKQLDSIVVEKKQDIHPLEEEALDKVVFDIEESNRIIKPEKLNPTKAGLYSAVLPGLGQYYNKKYWKIPIVWGAIGTGVGVSMWYNKEYKRYRKAFVAELNGVPHEFSDKPQVTAEALGNAQDRIKRQRDYAIAITGLVYLLNIVDAVVDAHLYQGRNDPDLALQPTVLYNEYAQEGAMAGISLKFRF